MELVLVITCFEGDLGQIANCIFENFVIAWVNWGQF